MMKDRLRKFLQLQLPQIIGLILVLVISSNLLSACNNQPNSTELRFPVSADEVTELRFAVPFDEVDAWQPLLDQFNENNKNIHISLDPSKNTQDTDSLRQQNMTELRKSSPSEFDLIYMDSIWLQEFAERGWLMELNANLFNDGFTTEELKNFEFNYKNKEVFPKDMYYEQKLYRIPFRRDVGLLFYRRDLLEKIDEKIDEVLPKTFDQLLEISAKLTPKIKEKKDIEAGNFLPDELYKEQEAKKDIEYVYLLPDRASEAQVVIFLEVLYNYGGAWISSSGEELSKSTAAISAVEFLRTIISQNQKIFEDLSTSKNSTSNSSRDGKNQNENEIASQFVDGKAVFMRNWPNTWLKINNRQPVSNKFGITSIVSKTEDMRGNACRDGWGFGIPRNSLHKAEAMKAIKFLTSAPSQQQFTLAYGSLPSRRSLFFDRKITDSNSYYPFFLDILENHSFPRPLIPQYRQASCILQNSLKQALDLNLEKEEYEAVMADAAKETEKLLKDGKYTGQYSNCREENS